MSERKINVEIEVPGSPEQVWDAIATGPGISSWFMPVHVEEREGGEIVHGPGQELSSTGTVVAWEPPHRFVYEEDGLPQGQLGTALVPHALPGSGRRVRHRRRHGGRALQGGRLGAAERGAGRPRRGRGR
jgi:uncharacterized protein YndB with AHSA1/START domain